MADDDVVLEDDPVDPGEDDSDEPTEVEILQEINDNIKYLIQCIVPNSVYQDFEFPEDDS